MVFYWNGSKGNIPQGPLKEEEIAKRYEQMNNLPPGSVMVVDYDPRFGTYSSIQLISDVKKPDELT